MEHSNKNTQIAAASVTIRIWDKDAAIIISSTDLSIAISIGARVIEDMRELGLMPKAHIE